MTHGEQNSSSAPSPAIRGPGLLLTLHEPSKPRREIYLRVARILLLYLCLAVLGMTGVVARYILGGAVTVIIFAILLVGYCLLVLPGLITLYTDPELHAKFIEPPDEDETVHGAGAGK